MNEMFQNGLSLAGNSSSFWSYQFWSYQLWSNVGLTQQQNPNFVIESNVHNWWEK